VTIPSIDTIARSTALAAAFCSAWSMAIVLYPLMPNQYKLENVTALLRQEGPFAIMMR
jgi:hypothetical protein